MAIPGFDLGPSDAKEAGEGATVHEGRLIATVVGRIEETENVVSVLSMNPITRPKKDDIVIGEVVKLNEKNGEIRLIGIEGTPRQDFLPQDLHAQFFITDLCEKYFHNMSDGVKVRDIVRAKVTEDAQVIKVEMKSAEELGVLWALCPSCGMTLQTQKSQDWNMVCTACKRTSFRAIADDYGNGENLSTLNNAGKRWGKEAETLFSKGASGRSTIIAADVREDGRERTFFRFEGDQGGRSSRQKAPKGCRLFVGGLPRSI
ncbi:MAG: exosome complex RNA-binding protein Csl4, partial [Candidatus Poseidoniaceae archaeon]